MTRTWIGLDCGVSTGVAVWENKQFTDLQTTDFWGAITLIDRYFAALGDKVTVVVENPNLNKAIHWNQHGNVGGINAKAKLAQNVGANKREASLIIDYCIRKNIPFEEVKPTTRKWTAEDMAKITGVKKRLSQHVRDSAKLVFQR